MFLSKFLPKIEIHCWGGLGSQLYAVVLRLELEAKYPSRKFTIVCHENGVTRRTSEISPFFPGSVISVEDYSQTKHIEVGPRSVEAVNGKVIVRSLLVKFLKLFSIVLDGDRSRGLAKVRFWTLQVRGHYSERRLNESALIQVRNMISQSSQVQAFESDSQNIFVHYRLGDLLALQNKSPISSDRVLGALRDLHSRIGSRICLFSDSPDTAYNLLTAGNLPVDIARDINAVDSLAILLNAHYFIGTNSKISIWAVILNSKSSSRVESYLPYELQHHIIANIGSLQNLKYY
jgi:hypothetical protein